MTNTPKLAAAFAPMANQGNPAMKPKQATVSKLITPVPDNANPVWSVRHPKYGTPSQIYPWFTRDGDVAFCTARFEWQESSEAKKAVLPLTWRELGQGKCRWVFKGLDETSPLYNLHLLAAFPDRPVLIVEGEKTADAAPVLFPNMVVTTTVGGSGSASKSDFSPLAGRIVVIAPDLDKPGEKYAQDVARLAREAGTKEVLLLRCEEIAKRTVANGVSVFRERPVKDGWDLADAVEEGWTADLLQQTFRDGLNVPFTANDNQPTAVNPLFRNTKQGLQRRVEDKEGNVYWEHVCSPLSVTAMARDPYGKGWCIVVEMQDPDGREHRLIIPFTELANEASPAIQRLASEGLQLDPKAKRYLIQYLSTTSALRRVMLVDRIGWHNGVFVLPNRHFGHTSEEEVEYVSEANHATVFSAKGTLTDWQALAALAIGNSRLILALAAAFAGPLLEPLGLEGGGFHFVGPSSKGKTTTLYLAGSVWGGGKQSGFLDSWRTTDNALEGLALARNHALLLLDEMGQVDAKALANSAYMLVNGQGKGRADRTGQRREPKRWLLVFLSTGEVGLADKVISETGTRVYAGQQVRLVDIAADTGSGFGLFEELHGFPNAKTLAEHITTTSLSVYGVAAEAFLTALSGNVSETTKAVRACMADFLAEHCPAKADGQVARVCNRFALAAAAGELAIAYGVLPWPPGTAIKGVSRCFHDWLANRGGIGVTCSGTFIQP